MNKCCVLSANGVLGKAYETALDSLIFKVDPTQHALAYVGEHPDWFAETEFAGKYLDTVVRVALTDTDKSRAGKAREAARLVVKSILDNQREDGYIGGLMKGREKEAFSVWNRSFTLIGLCSFAEFMPEEPLSEAALDCAKKIARYNAEIFTGNRDILDGANNGSQHLSIIWGLMRLVKLAPEEWILDIIRYIIQTMRDSDNNFLDFKSIFDLRSKKGIENFVILTGLLEYGLYFDESDALNACARYWDELERTQIRPNGNGTLFELWTENGNAPRYLGLELRPDENCVAVGWIELSAALYYIHKDAKYINAIEKSVYNHLLGALSDDGTDFAYYQPNFGHRITATVDSMYKCCRYRGFSAISFLPFMEFLRDGGEIRTMLYTDSTYEDDDIKIGEISSYPFGETAEMTVVRKTGEIHLLKLRSPVCAKLTVQYDRKDLPLDEASDGYLTLNLDEMPEKFTLRLKFSVKAELHECEIDGKKVDFGQYGPVLLTAEILDDTDFDTLCDPLAPREKLEKASAFYLERLKKLSIPRGAVLKPVKADGAKIAFSADGVLFKDYASAGRANRAIYTTYINVLE